MAKKTTNPTRRTTVVAVSLGPDDIKRMDALAKDRGVGRSQIVRDALKSYQEELSILEGRKSALEDLDEAHKGRGKRGGK